MFIRDRLIYSSERMLHKDYDRKMKKSLVVSLKRLEVKMN
jgi:hypothetical protein